MAKKKKKFYVVYSPAFQGIVESVKEYHKHTLKNKDAFGKSFVSKQAAEAYLAELQKNDGTRKTMNSKYYAIHGPLYTGIVYSKSDFEKYVVGQKRMHGKQVKSIAEGEDWIRQQSKQCGNKAEIVTPNPVNIVKVQEIPKPQVENAVATPRREVLLTIEEKMLQQCVLYIDGGFKDGIGKYGLLAYASTIEQPILKDFGYVYDDSFNALMNTGAELMACLRGLEWAYANKMNKIVVVYDYEGIIRLQKSMSEQRAVQVFTRQIARFQQVMDVQFIHVRHSNRELHNAVHALTQLVV